MKAAGKPKAPPRKPEAAPFFLPTTSGLRDFTFMAPAEEEPGSLSPRPLASAANWLSMGEGTASKLVRRKLGSLEQRSAFARRLDAAADPPDRRAAFHILQAMPPAAVDMEIRALGQPVARTPSTCSHVRSMKVRQVGAALSCCPSSCVCWARCCVAGETGSWHRPTSPASSK